MSDIEWGAEGVGLTYNKDSIVATWQHEDSDNASNSPIVYPITSYGVYNAGGDERTIQLLDTALDAGGGSGAGYFGFNNNSVPSTRSYGTPPPSPDWRPTIFVKKTLEKIFAGLGGGFKISSSFMNTPMFKKLVWSLPNFQYNNAPERLIDYSYGNHFTGEGLIGSFTASTSGTNAYTSTEFLPNLNDAGSDFVLNTDTNNTGWDSSLGSSGGIFTAQEYGYYSISANNFGLYFNNWINSPNRSTTVEYVRTYIQVKTVGQNTWNSISGSQTTQFGIHYGNTPSQTGSIPLNIPELPRQFLNKGDKVRLRVLVKMKTNGNTISTVNFHLFGSSTPTSATTSGSANGNYTIHIAPETVEYGQTYDLSEVIGTDIKQIDFIKGIAHAFNLQMTTNSESKIVYIEPFNNFYKGLKDAIDWTHKLDRSKAISDKWLKTDLKRIMTFKYKSDDADAKVKYRGEKFFNDIQDEYPYRETLPDTFEKGETTFENPFFAGTYNAKDNDTTGIPNVDTAYSACLWIENVSSNDEGRPDKGFGFIPRLLYWNKYSPAGATVGLNKLAQVQTWSAVNKIIVAKSAIPVVGLILSNIYPQATMINRDSSTSPVLSYGNVPVKNYDDATGVYATGETGSGLYETYYRNSVEMLKSNPRVRNVYINLKISDIINLDFTKLIYIDGVYWRISKVSDYMPNKNESTKVELIEWITSLVYPYNAPIFSGRPRNWASPPSSPYPPPVKNMNY